MKDAMPDKRTLLLHLTKMISNNENLVEIWRANVNFATETHIFINALERFGENSKQINM